MIYTTQNLYQNVSNYPVAPVVCAQNANTAVLNGDFLREEDNSPDAKDIAFILLYNAGPGVAWVNLGGNADTATNWQCQIAVGAMYNVPIRAKVCVYAVGGACNIGITVGVRDAQ